ncbi:MAG: HEPN domain-containing protein [Phycisphaerae bacterium]
MKAITGKLLAKAARSMEAGRAALAGGHVEAAAGRAYYAMFYVAEALLDDKGLRFKKHGGVHSTLGEHFVKTKTIDARHHRRLLAAFNKRITADYGFDVELSATEVGEMLEHAREFLETGVSWNRTRDDP